MPSKRSLALSRRKLLTVSALSISSSIAGCATLRARLEAFRLGTSDRQIAADWHPSPGQWPMRGYSYARTRHNPFATPPRHNPVRAWTYAVSSSNLQSLVVSDDTVFVRSEARLTALNATNGRKRWHRSRNNSGRLIYIAGRLYDVAQDRVRAIAPDGTELWSTELNREYYSLLERDGWIYLSNRNVVRLHADTGDIVSEESQDVWLPTTMGGPVYTGRFSLSAYDILDGRFISRWSTNPKGPYEPFAPVVGSDGLLYLAERAISGVDTETGRLSIYDATDGSKQAAITFPFTPLIPAVDTDTVYVSTSALIANAIGSDGRFVALSHEGTERWAYEPQAGLQPPVIANGTVYLGPHANTDVPLVALDAVTGETLWQKDMHRSPEIAAAGNTLFVGTDERVSAFREE